jgi:ArsR family transcriptional regulator
VLKSPHYAKPRTVSTLSQHLHELKNAGLIQGEINPPNVKYCINRDNWALARLLFNQLIK